MYSKSFNLREEAMKELKTFLEKYQKKGRTHSPSDVIKAAAFLIYRALYDKVHSVSAVCINIRIFLLCNLLCKFKSFLYSYSLSLYFRYIHQH